MIRDTYYSIKNRVIPQGDVVLDISRFRKKKADISPLAPSQKLLDDWNQDRIVWKEYVERYFQELRENDAVHSLIQHIADLAAREDVWLVCMEKQYPCHRFLVKQVIERILVARGLMEEPEDYSERYRRFKNLTCPQIKAMRGGKRESKGSTRSRVRRFLPAVDGNRDG